MEGHHYNRALHAHKLVSEALQHILLKYFMQWVYDKVDLSILRTAMQNVQENLTGGSLDDLQKKEFLEVQTLFVQYTQDEACQGGLSKLGLTYIAMVNILLRFICAIQEGNWQLLISSITDMIPYKLALDKNSYS